MHLSDDAIARLVAGEIGEGEIEDLDEHLDACESCRALVAAAARSSVLAERSGRGVGSPTWIASGAASAELPEGTRVSRYVIVGTLGRGGMGVVYLAFDSMLHREVALKFVRSELAGSLGDDGRELLLAEGRAVARVSHPNVVAVHDVGLHRGGIFVAMEYVEAGTLGESLAGRERDVGEILTLFAQAADGLAAVHEAGLVHRDFKPANVLVGAKGRVKVTDFGLASLRERALGEASLDGDVDASQRAGEIVGTPAYMAPEQFDGGDVGPRADQFAFAVALHEALTRRRPYEGKSLTALAVACRHAKVELPRDVPRAVHRAVRRALSPDPSDRLPDMNAFADALRQGPRWRRLVVPAVAVAGIGIAAAASLSEPAPCVGVSARVEQTWNDSTRGAIESALADRDPDAVQRITRGIDDYATELAAAQLRACTAHRVEGTRSDTMFDLQMRCLDARVVALETVSAKLPESEVARAIEAVVSLPSTQDCEDTERLSARAPVAPEDRETVDAAASALAQARVVAKLGDAKQAMTLVTAARDDVGERHPPLRAELTCFVADMHVSASDHDAAAEAFQRCADEAATAQDDALLAYAWIQLVGIDGVYRGHYDAALARTDMLRTILQRAGDPPQARGQYFHVLGLVRERAGQLEQAQVDLRTAIESFREAGAREDHAAALQSLAASLYNQGQPGESAPLLREALEVNRELYGPTHERVLASELNTIIVGIEDSGEEADALGELTKRIDAHLGTKHRLAVHVRRNRGDALRTAGRPEESVVVLEEAVKIASDVFGEHHATVAELHQLLAEGYRVLHRYEDAVASARRALEMQAVLYPKDHPDLAQSHETLAEALRSAGHAEQSVAEFEEAVRLSGLPPMDPVMQSRALTGLGLALLDLARREEACAALRRALELADAPDLSRVRLAEALIDHAKCVASLGDWQRAQTEGDRGLELYRAIEGHDPSMLADYELVLAREYRAHVMLRERVEALEASVAAWLSAHPSHVEHDRIRDALAKQRARP